MKQLLLIVALLLVGGFAQGGSLTLTDKTDTDYVITVGENEKFGDFAAKELVEILEKSTGVRFKTIAADSPEAEKADKRIILGRSKLARKLLGDKTVDSLQDEEALVTSRKNDLVLIGGGDLGTIYAVYDFVENEAGYRMYAFYPGMERFVKTDKLTYSGKETCRRPVFSGYRVPGVASWQVPLLAKFMFRNRNNSQFDFYNGKPYFDPKYRTKYYQVLGGQHGLCLFVPPKENEIHGYIGIKWEGMFDKHPEYFSMDKNGNRVPDTQLCFSNIELRKLMTERVLIVAKKLGDGIYMIGSNDHSNDRYCYCPGCTALEKKYNSVGGPLWDYMLEICEVMKKEHPNSFITTLAYKGPQQTEKAPDNIVFPDNFICDAAFLNADRSLKEISDEKMENGEIFSKYDNLLKWRKITKHVSYWYYGGCNPYMVYGRAQKEFRELRDAGVESVRICGNGGGVEFEDIAQYVLMKLMLDPDLDARAIAKEIVDFKYGKAAQMMMDYIDELENVRVESLKLPRIPGAEDTYESMNFIKPEQILRWQKNFDQMLELVKGDPVSLRNVHIARLGVDAWTIAFSSKIRVEYPDWEFDAKKVVVRGLSACDEAENAGMVVKRQNRARRLFETMEFYAYLKDDSLPAELQKYKADNVNRYLPTKPESYSVKTRSLTDDPDAAACVTMCQIVSSDKNFDQGIAYEFYDEVNRKWLLGGKIPLLELTPGKYRLVKIGVANISPSCRLVLGNYWDSSLSMNFGRYYDPSYQQRKYEIWVSIKVDGPMFDRSSIAKDSRISCDQVFLVNLGLEQ